MYISNVIERLVSELEFQTSLIRDHLQNAIRSADSTRGWNLQYTFEPNADGPRPMVVTVPALSASAYLAVDPAVRAAVEAATGLAVHSFGSPHGTTLRYGHLYLVRPDGFVAA